MNQPTYKKSFPEVQLSTPGEPLYKSYKAKKQLSETEKELVENLKVILACLENLLEVKGYSPYNYKAIRNAHKAIQNAHTAIKKVKGE